MLVVPVAQRPHRERGLRVRQLHPGPPGFDRECGRDLQRRECVPGVAVGPVDEVIKRIGVDLDAVISEAARIGERALQQWTERFGRDRL